MTRSARDQESHSDLCEYIDALEPGAKEAVGTVFEVLGDMDPAEMPGAVQMVGDRYGWRAGDWIRKRRGQPAGNGSMGIWSKKKGGSGPH